MTSFLDSARRRYDSARASAELDEMNEIKDKRQWISSLETREKNDLVYNVKSWL